MSIYMIIPWKGIVLSSCGYSYSSFGDGHAKDDQTSQKRRQADLLFWLFDIPLSFVYTLRRSPR